MSTSSLLLTNKNSRLVRLAQLTKSIAAADRLAAVWISLNDRNRVNRWNDARHKADRAHNIVDIDDVCVAFGRAVELANSRNVEALHELRPNLRSQAIAEDHSKLVRGVGLLAGCRQTVTAHLTDVLCNLKKVEEEGRDELLIICNFRCCDHVRVGR